MRIVLVAHNLRSAGGLSVGQNIVGAIPDIAPAHTFLMIVPKGCGYRDFSGVANVEVLECPKMNLLSRCVWERNALRRMISEFRPDWIWAIGNMVVTPSPCKQSLLLHNAHRVCRIKTPRHTPVRSRFFKWISDRELERSLRSVNRLYCQTETMRLRSHEVLQYPLNQIGLCPNAFSPFAQPSQHWPEELAIYKGAFILLGLTRYYPHKNLEVIFETFLRYRDLLHDVVCVLTISESQGTGAKVLIDRIKKEGLEHQIPCIGAIEQERIGEYFFAADIMILPTLLESFSGTYLEAMNFDTPIVTSDRDFAREVCGDAAVYIDPLSPASVKNGILKLKDSIALRKKLVTEGRERMTAYAKTWPDILRDVLDQEKIEHN